MINIMNIQNYGHNANKFEIQLGTYKAFKR